MNSKGLDVAVITQQPKAAWVAILSQPADDRAIAANASLTPMRCTILIFMVDGQNVIVVFTADQTAAAIILKNLLLGLVIAAC